MKSVIIKGTNGQLLFKIQQNKNGEYFAKVLTELDSKVTIKVITDNNKQIYFYPDKHTV